MSLYTLNDCSLSTFSNSSRNARSISTVLYRLEEVEKNQELMIEKFDLMIQSLLGLKKKFTGRKKIMDEDFEAFTHKNNEKRKKIKKKSRIHNKFDNSH